MANYFNRNKNFNKQHQKRPKVFADNSNIQEVGDGYVIVEGTVDSIHGAIIRVSVVINDKTFVINAHLSGKLKMHKIRIVQADIVILKVLLADLMAGGDKINGRITQRKDAARQINPEETSDETTT